MSDCLWGVLDGVNDAGLAVALAFGGRKITGKGFGIPLLLRYILETCDDTKAAVKVLQRVPTHMAYNISLIDAEGAYATVFISPTAPPIVREQTVSTNYQDRVEWEDYATVSATVERQHYLEGCLRDQHKTLSGLVRDFLSPPLYQTRWEQGFGTLYTVAYAARQKQVSLYWPHHKPLQQSFENFQEQTVGIKLRQLRSVVE
jgi:predicted choloylglycine hydrolase